MGDFSNYIEQLQKNAIKQYSSDYIDKYTPQDDENLTN